MRALTAIVLLGLSATARADEVYDFWSDGLAEMNGYKLVQPRYGELRSGTAVLVFVKEPFSDSARVKADPGRHPDSDVFEVMKLNQVKDFQTGIYDYNLMLSAFVGFTDHHGVRAGLPTKLTFSAQEWCGMTFAELLFDPAQVRERSFSYFDGEADRERTIEYSQDAITLDSLPIAVRGIPRELLKVGEARKVRVLPGLERSRLIHRNLAFTDGKLERRAARAIEALGQKIPAELWTLEIGPERYEWDVEAAQPRRLLGWRGPDGESATLLGSARLPYWSMNKNADEPSLKKLGLDPPARR